MKLISPKDARAIALKSELRFVKKKIKISAKLGNTNTEFRGALFPETILILKEAGYVVEIARYETGVYWGEN